MCSKTQEEIGEKAGKTKEEKRVREEKSSNLNHLFLTITSWAALSSFIFFLSCVIPSSLPLSPPPTSLTTTISPSPSLSAARRGHTLLHDVMVQKNDHSKGGDISCAFYFELQETLLAIFSTKNVFRSNNLPISMDLHTFFIINYFYALCQCVDCMYVASW